jgi:hypothetical protein
MAEQEAAWAQGAKAVVEAEERAVTVAEAPAAATVAAEAAEAAPPRPP